MTSSIQFTALSGARGEGPFCYLLEIDDAKILLDCGGYGSISHQMLNNLKRVARQVDVVLFSHSTLSHLGGYPFAYKFLQMRCTAYATLPVYNMGKLSASSIVSSLKNESGLELTIDDVNEAFDHITALRYSQPTNLPGKCKEIVITAFAAGHTLGGSIWKIKKGSDEILYAVNYNHIRESHLNATSLLYRGQIVESITKPTLLITDTRNATRILPTQKSRKESFVDTIKTQVESGGNVLIPVDSASRVLELVYLLERYMDNLPTKNYRSSKNLNQVYLISRYGYSVFRYAKSMLEWMNENLANEFTGNRKNPFELKHIKIVRSVKSLE
ncbi:hypothetical protein BB558_006881, partial [Smittium angustum]